MFSSQRGQPSLARVSVAAFVGAMLLFGALVAAPPPAHAGSPQTLYVDGKLGSDTNAGKSDSDAFKTIDRGARQIPKGEAAGWRVVVRGYADYVYRERPIHQGWASWGTSDNPILFEAHGYQPNSTSYVKPTVIGSDSAPLSGQGWTATASDGVYYTHWLTKPAGFVASGGSGDTKSALFQDGTTWLWNTAGLADLAAKAKSGLGGYWWDASADRLYVAAADGGSPVGRSIEVIVRNTFYFKGEYGVRNVAVRGFRVQHSDNGIAFVSGADGGTVVDNETIGNLFMGIHTSGRSTASGVDPASGHVISRNVSSYNTVQGVKLSSHTQQTTVCDNTLSFNALQGLKVQGRPPGSGGTSYTRDILICRNNLANQIFRTPHRSNDNATGVTVANGARRVTIRQNDIFNSGIGIHIAQEGKGMPLLDEIRIERNLVHDNRRFGLNIYDGRHGSGSGRLWATGNVYWANYIGVMVDERASNKVLRYETIYGSTKSGVVVNGRDKGTTLALKRSLVTHSAGAGVQVSRKGSVVLAYVGLGRNAAGAIKTSGSVSVKKKNVNTKGPGYLSTDPSSPSLLMLSATSFQRTAGPDGTPIGARY